MNETMTTATSDTLKALIPGVRYTALVTGTLDGVRHFREVGFTAARSSVEDFIRGRETTPDQDRVFVVSHPRHPDKHEPRLYVTGSIREAVVE